MEAATATLAPAAPLAATSGEEMHALVRRLYPICRSITGDGVRQTLHILREFLPALQVHEVPTGTAVLDWHVPREWNIRDAWIKNRRGERVVDFRQHNLHVLGYSMPVRGWYTRAELLAHLYSLPEQPTLIPYRTAYYAETWGFCLRHEQLLALTEPGYEVCIDSSLTEGALTYGELLLPGELTREVLISCHICHPSLANDNLSAVAVATQLALHLQQQPRHYSYRFVFAPGTIGAITWLSRNPEAVARIQHGLVLSLLGMPGVFTYKKSRRENTEVDRAVAMVLRDAAVPHSLVDFVPYGYDERQYCSPGFNLPVGCLSRTPYAQFPEYHTSADDLALVQAGALADSLRMTEQVLAVLDTNGRYLNLSPFGEPELGRRGLYGTVGGTPTPPDWQLTLLWVLNLSDGQHSLLDIAERAKLPFEQVRRAAELLTTHQLLMPLPE